MSEQRIAVFMPSEDGEYVPIKFTSAEKDLKEDAVVIFLDEENKAIFIWTGASSPVRKRFISSQIARQMRLEKGLTHRISTEDQGNETERFWDFINRLKGIEIQAKTLLEVSPPPGAADLPLPEFSDLSTSKPVRSSAKIRDFKKIEAMKKITTAQKTSKSTTKSDQIVPPSPPESFEKPEFNKLKSGEQIYFYIDQLSEVILSTAKLLVKASDQNRYLNSIHVSSAATDGKIGIYSIPGTSKTVACKTEKAIFTIYLKPLTETVIEINDLKIPVPVGNSIYFTCPEKTFISLNLES